MWTETGKRKKIVPRQTFYIFVQGRTSLFAIITAIEPVVTSRTRKLINVMFNSAMHQKKEKLNDFV